jgi:hypothetical protein
MLGFKLKLGLKGGALNETKEFVQLFQALVTKDECCILLWVVCVPEEGACCLSKLCFTGSSIMC